MSAAWLAGRASAVGAKVDTDLARSSALRRGIVGACALTTIHFPSVDIPESQKLGFSEADVHSTLFEPDMRTLGFPPRTSSQADGEYFVEQRSLALRRLRNRHATGRYDGLYLIGNAPVVLCEIKRYDALDSPAAASRAVSQLQRYALSDDFEQSPPFLILYCGDTARTRFFRLRAPTDPMRAREAYEELQGLWEWSRIKEHHLRGAFAEEVVSADRLREILIHHLDQIENDLRSQVAQAISVVKSDQPPPLVGEFGRWLLGRPHAARRMRQLYERKVAEVGTGNEQRVADEMVTQAALNYLNKVFFLNLCEDRHLRGFYRIMREFLPRSGTSRSCRIGGRPPSWRQGSLPGCGRSSRRSKPIRGPRSSSSATRSTMRSSTSSRCGQLASRCCGSTERSAAWRIRQRASRR
jgi:hypothetical protein